MLRLWQIYVLDRLLAYPLAALHRKESKIGEVLLEICLLHFFMGIT